MAKSCILCSFLLAVCFVKLFFRMRTSCFIFCLSSSVALHSGGGLVSRSSLVQAASQFS